MTIKGYRFYIRPDTDPASEWTRVTDGVVTNPDFQFIDLLAGTDYEIAAKAVDMAGNESTLSTPLKVTTVAHDPFADPMSAGDVAIVDALVNQGFGKAKGVLVSISGPKGTYSKAYGNSYNDSGGAGRALTLDDKMHYGSTTKMNTALLICRQIDLGHLSFDTTLDTFSTTAAVTNSDRITIKHLLMNRSGVYEVMGASAAFGQNSYLHPTAKADPLPAIINQPSQFEPGTKYEYCNSNWILLGEVLRQLDIEYGTSRPTPQIMQEDCYDALGLVNCEWRPTPYMTAPYSRGWTDNMAYSIIVATIQSLPLYGVLGWLYWALAPSFSGGWPTTPTYEFTAYDPSYPDCAGCLDGTVEDLRKFGEALRDGELLSAEIQQLRAEIFGTYANYTPTAAHEGTGWMGVGLGLMSFGDWRGWNGASAGYSSALWFNVENGAVIAILHNYFGLDPWQLFMRLSYALWPDSSTQNLPWILRPQDPPPELAQLGGGSIYNWHAIGDSDGDADIPHKVPFYV